MYNVLLNPSYYRNTNLVAVLKDLKSVPFVQAKTYFDNFNIALNVIMKANHVAPLQFALETSNLDSTTKIAVTSAFEAIIPDGPLYNGFYSNEIKGKEIERQHLANF
jgi:hypothetical protein